MCFLPLSAPSSGRDLDFAFLPKQRVKLVPGGAKIAAKVEVSSRIDIWTQEPLLNFILLNEISEIRPHKGRAVNVSLRPNRAMPNPQINNLT